MKNWKRRYITVRGKITLIKTLMLPKLTHILVSLPKPPNSFFKRLKTMMFHFIWGGKVDRLQRLSVCKPYIEGGLAMVELDTYVDALKATWVRREIQPTHSWTSLFQDTVSDGKFIWEMNGDSLANLAKKISNPFWAEVLRAFANVSRGIDIDVADMSRCSLWYSDKTKHKTTCIDAWRRKGLCYLSDIVDDEGQILSFQNVKQIYQIGGSYLDYTGLVRSLPREWKSVPRKVRADYPIIHPQVEFVLSKEKGAKYLYDVILHMKTKSFGNTWEICWERKYGPINWSEIYWSIYKKSSVYYHMLCYKIITQIVATNRMLHVMGIKSSPLCNRCKLYTETIEHKFWFCCEVNKFWKDIADCINNLNIMSDITFSSKKVILGVSDDIVVNRIISIGKSVISKYENINVQIFIIKFKIEMENEKCVSRRRGSVAQFNEIWGGLWGGL